MTARAILLIGPLPPVRSHAALMTAWVARTLAQGGVEVTCLLDELAPPPDLPATIKVIRSYDVAASSESLGKLPRLYIVGGSPDSLPALELLAAAPGAVLPVEDSLFDIALPWAERTGSGRSGWADWLTRRFGEAGARLSEGQARASRRSANIAREIPAFDLLLGNATTTVAVSDRAQALLSGEGFSCRQLSLPASTAGSDGQARGSDAPALIIGMPAEAQRQFEELISDRSTPLGINVAYSTRFDPGLAEAVAGAKMVAILGGGAAMLCPFAALAAHLGKPLILAGQPWSEELPAGHFLTVRSAGAQTDLFHAIAALASVPGLAKALCETAQARHADPESTMAADLLIDVAATAEPSDLGLAVPAVPATFNASQDDVVLDAVPSGPVALVGAVPARPILEQRLPGLPLERCPRFATISQLESLVAFFGDPAPFVLDRMGFEAPVLDSDSEQTAADAGVRTIAPWADIQPALRHAREAVAFGVSSPGIPQAPPAPATEPLSWPFILPDHVLDRRGPTAGFDADAGIAWQYDAVRDVLRCTMLTGAAGAVTIAPAGGYAITISDGTCTHVSTADGPSELAVAGSGMVCFKMAKLPGGDSPDATLLKELASAGLNLGWSPR